MDYFPCAADNGWTNLVVEFVKIALLQTDTTHVFSDGECWRMVSRGAIS
jgi:hypothetical protein